MATADQIAEVRRLADEPTADTYTDVELGNRVDALGAGGDLRTLAAAIWREKAAKLAGLVDVQEGTSNRKLSQLYNQALAMARSYDTEVAAVVTVTRRVSRTRPIERQ